MLDWVTLTPHTITDYGGGSSLPEMYTQVWSKALPYTAAVLLLWALVYVGLGLAGFGATIGEARRGTWALKISMLAHHGLIAPLAVYGLLEDPAVRQMYGCFGCTEAGLRMNRDAIVPLAAQALTPVTLGYFFADLLLLSQWNLTKSGAVENGLMLFHHLASLLVWPAAVYFDWVARYVLIMLSYEFTGVWLTLLWLLSTANMKKSMLYKVVGLLFTASFVVMRMVGAIPQLIAMWNAPPWSVDLEHKVQPGGIHPLCWIFSLSLVFPHILNLFWGVKVVSGFMAVMMPKKKKDKASKD
mmetsp:Transcript_70592/g.147857  ORF Transcript_70592/g.147857 Transcript_70592/m.147857 type:complete len:299 (+) Transcript_70592:223-1119(+)|eukprot:CAMPEP_0206424442 /NCGR_PEP_ID=MMETSP0324_2-20121206/3231_1 /ASSEMBLY_ACC=CAM_ASM_000836 /TAXON_ID=2866 /ORGANISM="Crypthecodinium cohnii, Strain Seligo" /LENGTH=298 /DNA_ID=CAMNT_0053889099 /DNA_START=146 /DNA_END=1042 /DNA_ORIENTATION=-